jgi:energy-coupling factor transport system ATP-binding protein
MICVNSLTFSYSSADSSILQRIGFETQQGELILITGPTGSGKSTLLKTLIGLAPHFTGGQIKGSIKIDGQETVGKLPHELAHLVGYVNQQPEGAFATDTVEEELAYGMEQLGFAPDEMRLRVAEIAKTLGLQDLLAQPLEQLSGGQQQRVAIGAALAAGQRILLLDEPTSSLDEDCSQDVLEALRELCNEQQLTVLLSEHRIERVLPYIDRALHLRGDGLLTELDLESVRNPEIAPAETSEVLSALYVANSEPPMNLEPFKTPPLSQSYEGRQVLSEVALTLQAARVTTVTGENGSGKTSLLNCVLNHAWAQKLPVAMVPQNSRDLLILNSISAELAAAEAHRSAATASGAQIFESLVGRIDPATHPRDLSVGQQLALALAIQLSKEARLVLLDEPTRGLDAVTKSRLIKLLQSLRSEGRMILLATHDHEFAARISDHQIELVEGKVTHEN